MFGNPYQPHPPAALPSAVRLRLCIQVSSESSRKLGMKSFNSCTSHPSMDSSVVNRVPSWCGLRSKDG